MQPFLRLILATAGFGLAAATVQAEPITLDVFVQGEAGPYRLIAEAFQKENADIRIAVATPIPTYEEMLQRTLRGIIVGDPPDIAFQGYNLMRQAAASKAVIDVTERVAADPSIAAQGFETDLAQLCTVGGRLVGLPFALSVPILYVNADLVRRAGGDPDALPTGWDGILALAERIRALDATYQGIHFRYNHSGNWSFQALITAEGGRMMEPDDQTIAFAGPAGQKALDLFRAFVDRGGMIDLNPNQARQAFLAGTVGFLQDSSAVLAGVTKGAAGRFAFRAASYPLAAGVGRLPPGGNCATIATADPVRQQAAWTFVKYVVGPTAQAILAEQSGYAPVNRKATDVLRASQADAAQRAGTALVADLLHRLTEWYGFPPPNGAKITDAIQGRIQSVVAKSAAPTEALRGMVADVETLRRAGAH